MRQVGQLDSAGDRQASRRQRLPQIGQLREWRTLRRLLIVRGMQAEQIAAQSHDVSGALSQSRHLHHINHHLLALRPRAIESAGNRRIGGDRHNSRDIGASAEGDIGFGFARVHNLQIRHQRQLRISRPNSP